VPASFNTVLVLGATGRQGGATTRQLLHAGWRVRALVRDPDRADVHALRQAGVEIVQGDYDDRPSLDAAMKGIHGVFSMQASVDEVRQGKQIADAAKAASVQHIVYSSVQSAAELARVGGGGNKWELEQYLWALRLPATVLRPAFFMDTVAIGPRYGVPIDTFPIAIREDVLIGLIAVDDIGAFATLAFSHPEDYVDRTIEIAGDALTPPQITATIGHVTGRSIRHVPIPIEELAQQNPEIARAIEYLNTTGYPVDLAPLRALHPDLMTLQTWLAHGGSEIFAAST
jgi:uncharacterized protein YbjT (DUF2867 family)